MNERPIILTHCGKLGDFLYALPIAECFYRSAGRKVHWVLPQAFAPFNHITNLLCCQEHCLGVTLVDHPLANLDAGGQPYRFNPADFGIVGDYYNLGFRGYPTKYITEFYAEEHGLSWMSYNYRLRLWGDGARPGETKSEEILRSGETAMAQFCPSATVLPPAEDLLKLARRIQSAKEFHTWYGGLAVLAYLAGIPAHVYRMPGHASKALYFPEDRDLTWHEVNL